MPYLETEEEEAAERIADLYEHRDDPRKKEEKHIDTPDLESEKKSSEKINQDIEGSEESEKIEYEKINMEAIDYLYENMNKSSFKFVTVDGNKYKINKVLDFLKNIKNGRYNDNNIKEFYKKGGIDKIINALIKSKETDNIKKILEYMYRLDEVLFRPINSLKEENTDKARSFKDQKGKGYANLPILLSKAYTNNSSKKLIRDIKQLINNLYDNKQITKQVYNNLIETITYKNDS